MKRLLVMVVLSFGLVFQATVAQPQSDFIPLFDGKSLTGWVPVNTSARRVPLPDGQR
jgi:hypothetical protein